MEREGGEEGKEQKKRSEKKGRDLQKSAITAKQIALNARKPLVGVDVGVFANTYLFYKPDVVSTVFINVSLRRLVFLYQFVSCFRSIACRVLLGFDCVCDKRNAFTEAAGTASSNTLGGRNNCLLFVGEIFTARCQASAVLAMGLCLSICPSQVGVLSKRMNESSWFLACELPSTRPTLC